MRNDSPRATSSSPSPLHRLRNALSQRPRPHPPARFSRGWWIVIAATTGIVGLAMLGVLMLVVKRPVPELLPVWFVATLLGDLTVAVSMEAIAPSRIVVGPGDRLLDQDAVVESAVVVSGFGDIRTGTVCVRGENWRARLASEDEPAPIAGAPVAVVARDGLTLLVAVRRQT